MAQDTRYSLRALRRQPAFTALAVTMLAAGIGVNTAVFTVTNAVLFKGFRSIEGNDRILYIGAQKNGTGCCASYPDFQDWRAQVTAFEGMGAVADLRITLSDRNGVADADTATRISANTFALLGRTPIVGRDFLTTDEQPGAPPTAILSYRLWQSRYASDARILGESIRINGVQTTVIGVMPQGFAFPQNQDLWLPLIPTPDLQPRDARNLWFTFGRLKPGATREQARVELETIGNRLALAYPRTNQGWIPLPRSFAEYFVGPNARVIYGSMWGAVGFVLLIACANLANLMLARAIDRSREVSVRIALGVGRWRVVRQLVLESLILSLLGAAAGWWIARWSVRAYELSANAPTRSWSEGLLDYSMDYRVLAYAVAVSLATGLMFGLIPALRLSKLDVNAALKDGGRGSTRGNRGRSLSTLLVVGEMALAVVLLSGAGVMIRSFVNLSTTRLGVDTSNVVTGLVATPAAGTTPAAQTAFYDRLTARVQAIAGVESVTMASALPLGGTRMLSYETAGDVSVDPDRRPQAGTVVIGPEYFAALGAALVSGREFKDLDGISSARVAIVNQQFANRQWPGDNPLGKSVRLFEGGAAGEWLTIVGVASNIVQNDSVRRGRSDFDPLIYLPYRQAGAANAWIIARAHGPAGAFAMALRRELQLLDPDRGFVLGPFTLADRLAGLGDYWSTRNDAALFTVFAAIALVLASVGLYAVIAHSVSQRIQEIGIRMAMGGTARDILTLVLMQGMVPSAIGLIVGLAASAAVMPVLGSMLVHVSPADPLTFAGTSVVLIASALLGCLVPARRAMRLDPLTALRCD